MTSSQNNNVCNSKQIGITAEQAGSVIELGLME